MIPNGKAYVSLAVQDTSALGCLVLGNSLRKLNSKHNLIVIVANDLSLDMRNLLSKVFDEVIDVPALSGSDFGSLTKIECWNLTKYSKCVFLDSDALVLQNCDELFDMEELSAVPDTGWPDCFNTGVFVFKPSRSTYEALLSLAKTKESFDGSEQGLLNTYFGNDWKLNLGKRMSFVYNLIVSCSYTYSAAFKQFGGMTKIARFASHPKPWLANWNYNNGNFTAQYSDFQQPFLQTWLDVFRDTIYEKLPKICHDIANSGETNTIWNLLQASKLPEQYWIFKEIIPQTSYETFASISPQPSPTATFSAPHRQSWNEFQPQQYSDQIKVDFHSESTSPIRAIIQSHHQTTTSPFLEPVSPEIELGHESSSMFSFQPPSPPIPLPTPTKIPSEGPEVPSREKSMQVLPELSVKPKTVAPHPKSKKHQTEVHKSTSSHSKKKHEESTQPWLGVKPRRMKAWEEGNIDYMGKDKFENIQKKLDDLLEKRQAESKDKKEKQEGHDKFQFETVESMEDCSAFGFAKPITEQMPENEFQSETTKGLPTDLPGYQINDFSGMYEWESGQIDYMGKDSSDNIIRRLNFLFSNTNYDLEKKK